MKTALVLISLFSSAAFASLVTGESLYFQETSTIEIVGLPAERVYAELSVLPTFDVFDGAFIKTAEGIECTRNKVYSSNRYRCTMIINFSGIVNKK